MPFQKGHKTNLGKHWNYNGKPMTTEHRKKIGFANSIALKGRIIPDETRKKMSIAKKGNKNCLGLKHTKETKRKMSKAHKGKKLSEKIKQKMSERMKGNKMSEKTKEKLRQYRREKASNWKGGLSFNPYSIDWTETLRTSIRERNNYICQLCGIHQEELQGWYKKLDVHHIDYNKKNCNPDNLITLCRDCHLETNQNRDYWMNYFQNLFKE